MSKPLTDPGGAAMELDKSNFALQDLEQKRIEWVRGIREAALAHDIKIRSLDQKSPSFEFAYWRVNIEHLTNYDSVIIMWTVGKIMPTPARNKNWTDVAPSDKKQGWNFRRRLNPSDLYVLLFELREPLLLEHAYRDFLGQNVTNAMAMHSSERGLKSAAFSKSSPRVYEVKTRIFNRNPYVVAEVLLRANGTCEACGNSAPFIRRSDDTPYLEVHHTTPLADGGGDSVENAVALCPNCHRKAHFG